CAEGPRRLLTCGCMAKQMQSRVRHTRDSESAGAVRIIHRVGLHANTKQRRELETLGVKLTGGVASPNGGDPLMAFDVDENHPNWGSLRSLFQKWRSSDMVRTEFTKKEIDSARWLEIGAWHNGHPQPDEDAFGYRRATYDLTDWCEQCGIGLKQKAPFQ